MKLPRSSDRFEVTGRHALDRLHDCGRSASLRPAAYVHVRHRRVWIRASFAACAVVVAVLVSVAWRREAVPQATTPIRVAVDARRTASAPAYSKPDDGAHAVSEPPPSLHEPAPWQGSWARELRELRALAAHAPDAALTRVALMRDKHERKAAATEVSLVIGEADPARALRAAWSFDLGKLADEAAESAALERLAAAWAENDLVSAIDWARSRPADEEGRRDRVMKGIVAAMAPVRPGVAGRLAMDEISPDSGVRIDAVTEVLRLWTTLDYTAALEWVSRFPPGALRDQAIEQLARVDGDAGLIESHQP